MGEKINNWDYISLDNWNFISHTHYYDRNPFSKISTIIFEIGGDFFYIKDEFDKIKDVSNMPIYIVRDWVKYNKKDLDIATLNKQIRWFEAKLEDPVNSIEPEKTEETIKTLKSIRRDLIIKGII